MRQATRRAGRSGEHVGDGLRVADVVDPAFEGREVGAGLDAGAVIVAEGDPSLRDEPQQGCRVRP